MGNGRISRLRAFAARVLGLFRPRKHHDVFDEEVRAHLRLLTDRFVARGMSQQDAAAAARRQFGNTTLLQEGRRELRTLVSMEDLGRDLRYALRSLARSRAFAVVAIVTLGLGIGASTAIFSVIDNVVVAVPVQRCRAHGVSADQDTAGPGRRTTGISSDGVLEFEEQNHVFDGDDGGG